MKRIITLGVISLLSLGLSGFAHFGGQNATIAIVAPGGGETSTVHGSKQPQSIDVTHASVSRWADDIPLAERTTPSGSPGQAGYTMDVLANWQFLGPNIAPLANFTTGDYKLNGVNGMLWCVHANHVSNVPVQWTGAAGSQTPSPNVLVSVKSAIDGGAYVTAPPMICPLNDVGSSYAFFVPMSQLADGEHEVRACAKAASGYEACLSSVKNVSETFPQIPYGTTTQTSGSLVAGGVLNGTTETLDYTQNMAGAGYTVIGATYNGGLGRETVTVQMNGQSLFAFLTNELVNVQGITVTGGTSSAWNGNGFIVISSTATGCVSVNPCFGTATLVFANPNAPTGTYASGGIASDYNAGFVIGQTISATGISPSNWNPTGPCPGGTTNTCAVVTGNVCSGFGAGQCHVSFVNASASGSFSSGAGSLVTMTVAQFTDPAHNHQALEQFSNGIAQQFLAITGSTDPNIPNYCQAPSAGCPTVSTGVYCYNPTQSGHPLSFTANGYNSVNPNNFELHRARWVTASWNWSCALATETVTGGSVAVVGNQTLETITYTDATNYYPAIGDNMTTVGIVGGSMNFNGNTSATTVTAAGCTAGACSVTFNVPATANGSWLSAGTIVVYNPTPNVYSQGGTNTMVATELYAGSKSYVNTSSRDNTMAHGSLFFWTNAGNSIKAPTVYIDPAAGVNNATTVAGLAAFPGNCQNPAAPCQTLDVAVASMGNTAMITGNVLSVGNTVLPCGPGGSSVSALTFSHAGNLTGGTPISAAVGYPVNYVAAAGTGAALTSGASLMVQQSYFISAVSGNAYAVAKYPGGPCITESASLYTGSNEFWEDTSFSTVNFECLNPVNCPAGKPEQIFWGHFGAGITISAGSKFSWMTVNAPPTQAVVAAGNQSSGIYDRINYIGNIIIPSYTAVTTGDIPPLPLVGPPGIQTIATLTVSGGQIHLTYNDPNNNAVPVGVNNFATITGASCTGACNLNLSQLPIVSSSCVSGTCTANLTAASASGTTYNANSGTLSVSYYQGGPATKEVTGGSVVGTSVTLNYFDPSNEPFQVLSGSAAQLINVTLTQSNTNAVTGGSQSGSTLTLNYTNASNFVYPVATTINVSGVVSSLNTVTGGTATAGSPGSITLNYTSATGQAYQTGATVTVAGVVSNTSSWNGTGNVSASSCVSTACTVTYALNVATSTYTSGGTIVQGNWNAAAATVTVSSCASTACTVSYTLATTISTYSTGGSTYSHSWDCTGSPTQCQVQASSCNGSGACSMTYLDTDAAPGNWTTGGMALIQTIALPVNIPASAGPTAICSPQPCTTVVPPGVNYRTSLGGTLVEGVTPTGPGGGFIFYCGTATSIGAPCAGGTGGAGGNTALGFSPEQCITYAAGENASFPNLPPNTGTYESSLDVSGGVIHNIILSSALATGGYGFTNFADCPIGSKFTFTNLNYIPIFSPTKDMWFDGQTGQPMVFNIDNLESSGAVAGAFGGMTLANNSYFTGTGIGQTGATDLTNVVLATQSGVCWSLYYQGEHDVCQGLSNQGFDSIPIYQQNPSLGQYSLMLGQTGLANSCGAGCTVAAGSNTEVLPVIPAHMVIGWIIIMSCQDVGNGWTEDEYITGYNSATNTITFVPWTVGGAGYTLPPTTCAIVNNNYISGIHADTKFDQQSNQIGSFSPGQDAFPGEFWYNAIVPYTYCAAISIQGSGTNTKHNMDYENNLFTTIGPTGPCWAYEATTTDALMLNNGYPRGTGPNWGNQVYPWHSGPGSNNNVFVINQFPQFSITSATFNSSTSVETLNFTDPKGVGLAVGTSFSAQNINPGYPSFDTTMAAAVLTNSCVSTACTLTFNQPYFQPPGITAPNNSGVIVLPVANPSWLGAPGCWIYGPSYSVEVNGVTGTYVWPASNFVNGSVNNWSGPGGYNDLTPWYPTYPNTTVGTGGC